MKTHIADMPTASVELVRQTPLVAGAAYLNFVSQYGAAIVTTLAIVYGVLQLILRSREHKAFMLKHAPE